MAQYGPDPKGVPADFMCTFEQLFYVYDLAANVRNVFECDPNPSYPLWRTFQILLKSLLSLWFIFQFVCTIMIQL